jgi:queuine tRNA-ribosyltransferase/7-cyano-7-deazaguanine tRNA-ribosyltransferase
MKNFSFKIIKKDKNSSARLGEIKTPHGKISTPAFVAVGTQATVKSLSPEELKIIGAEVILANTYHLLLRPGDKIIKKLGGLHKFMHWNGPIITDSGGFQVFSLGLGLVHGVGKIANIFPEEAKFRLPIKNKLNFVKIDNNGVVFKSHLDGKTHHLTPEKSIEIQENLGADIIFAFDECTSPLSSKEYTQLAMKRTHNWAKQCLRAKKRKDQALFGIVQGGEYRDLREESAKFINSLPFAGFGIGGSLGKSKKDMHNILEWVVPLLDEKKPRHLLGIGEIEDLFNGVERGVDLFDCVAPTRMARNGTLLTKKGRMNILKSGFKNDKKPIEENCECYTCKNFSRAYLNHLFRAEEILAHRLATIHNLYFITNLMKEIRMAIKNNRFSQLKNKFISV